MPGLISDQLIDNLRTVAYKQLVTPVRIYRSTRAEGAYGTEETETLVTSTNCWYKPGTGGNLTVQPGGAIAQASPDEFRFAVDTDVEIGDRIVLSDSNEGGYLVQDLNDHATIQLYLKVWTQRIE